MNLTHLFNEGLIKTSDLSGDKITEFMAVKYDKLIQAQNNIQILRAELERRNGLADIKPEEPQDTDGKEA